MCEANAYIEKDGKEELILESVDVVEPLSSSEYRLISIFGEQKTVRGEIKRMNLVNHRIVFSTETTLDITLKSD